MHIIFNSPEKFHQTGWVGNTVIERPIRTTPKVTSGNKDDLFLADFVADDDEDEELVSKPNWQTFGKTN